jgi:hypothetical protein
LQDSELVKLGTVSHDRVRREMDEFRVTLYGTTAGRVSAYLPASNGSLPIWHHAAGSETPAAESIPVLVQRLAPT